MASKVDKISEMEIGENFPRVHNRRQNNEKTIAKVKKKFYEKGLGRGIWLRNLSRLAMQNGSQNSISDAHFTYFPLLENCILEMIEEPLAKKASKTAESCVETSDEDDNYDDDLSSDDLSGVVATNQTTEMR